MFLTKRGRGVEEKQLDQTKVSLENTGAEEEESQKSDSLASSINAEVMQGTERAIEVKAILLQSHLREGDLVDVRIQYPNGEEYIVLSKRGCHELSLEEGRVTFFLTEEEMIRLSSSIVDCVQMKGTLYTVRYLRDQKQESSISNYVPSIDLCNFIKQNPNVVGESSSTLEKKVREEIENRISVWEQNAQTTEEIEDTEQFVWETNQEIKEGESYYVD